MLEDLIHMIDVSVNSKYGADLERLTRMLMDSLRGSFEFFRLECKQDTENLPRQVRAMVQQVLGEVREKREIESPGASATAHNLDKVVT
jgi:hypothetical protein